MFEAEKQEQMKRPIIEVFFALMAICMFCCVQTTQAQVGIFVPKDERIAKFQKEILQYLVRKSNSGVAKAMKLPSNATKTE